MPAYLGLDCGGSSTRALVIDDDGNEVFEGSSGPANIASTPADEILSHLNEATAGAPDVIACCGCFAGILTHRDGLTAKGLIAQALPDVAAETFPDYHATLAADPDADMVVIAGTGSLIASRVAGKVRKSGGGGALLGDEGSAFDISRRALASQVLGPEPMSGASDVFKEEVYSLFGSQDPNEIIAAVYRSSSPQARVARLAQAVAFEAKTGRLYALSAVRSSLAALASNMTAHIRNHHPQSESVEIRLAGGLWDTDPWYMEQFLTVVEEWDAGTGQMLQVSKLVARPVVGAARLAKQFAHEHGIS